MNRRKLVFGSLVGAAAIGTGAVIWNRIEPNKEPLTIEFALANLKQLLVNESAMSGEWNLYQVLTHCAQSVEYSLAGFPEHKPALFKNTVGKIAFSAFHAKGKMTHALNEVIPGAPSFSTQENIAEAGARFEKALLDFKNYSGSLAPHFAYGDLTKEQYEAAHVMHFNNHLLEIESPSAAS